MKPLSVLVADDEEDIRVLLHLWLTQAGHKVDLVANAKEALRLIKQQQFDLLVSDVLMPDGDGIDLMESLRTVQSNLRILAISGGGRYLEGEDCLKIARGWGAHAVLIKPFGREQFEAAIQEALVPARQSE